ncbi:MAG: hypothetical protein R3195_07555 [Gemmatimonadota bacterium]|nr:hypothetical protein [Gemmatimonadota bacterium]
MPPADTGSGPPPGDAGEDLPAEAGGHDDLPARRPASQPEITSEQLERVIRRASDLQFRRSTSVAANLDADEVVRIGEEVGIEARYVQQAIAEVRAEALVPEAPEDDGFMARWAGPAMVRVSRVVPGDLEVVERNLDHYLREKELLQPVRSQRGRSLWEPAGGLVSSMRRAMDVGGHGYRIARARRLQVAIEQLESGWSLVTLTVDMGNLRNETAGGWMFGMGMIGTVGSIGLTVATGGAPLAFVGVAALLAGAVGTARYAGRKHVRTERERIELTLLGLLDRLERGESLEPNGEPWHQKLLRSAGIDAD